MQRPRQHIIETESIKKFQTIIPDSWVIREMNPDYGLDFIVEIFEKDSSTGNFFYVQLKGSDQEISNFSAVYHLKREHIEYYYSIATPVLFVLYSTITNQFWGLWCNQLKDTLIEKRTNQKTHKLNLTENHIINIDFFKNLQSSFTIDIHKKINISFNSQSIIGTQFHGQLKKWIEHYYGDFVEFDNNLLPDKIHFSYDIDTDKILSIVVSDIRRTFNLKSIDLSDDTFLYLSEIDVDNIPIQINEVLILISTLLYKSNIYSSIEILNSSFYKYDGDLLTPILLFDVTRAAIESNLIFEIQSFSEAAINRKYFGVFQYINMCILIFNNNGKLTNLYQSNLLRAIYSIEDDNLFKGTLCYNLANSYRGNKDIYLANEYYQKARKYKPEYLNIPYWWFEYAGVLYHSKHYLFSEKFYKKSHELRKDYNIPLIHYMIGDALFMQGKFSNAISHFEKFLNVESDKFYEECYYKNIVCKKFCENGLDNRAFDINKSADLVQLASDSNDFKYVLQAIELYPLNGHAWFNYGVFLKKNNDSESSFMSFLTAGCIQDWDIEAWKNCFLLAFNLKDEFNLYLILKLMIDKFGAKGVNYITEQILGDPYSQIDKKGLVKIARAISDMAWLIQNNEKMI